MSITAEKECAKPSAHNRRHGVVSGECLCYKIKGWGISIAQRPLSSSLLVRLILFGQLIAMRTLQSRTPPHELFLLQIHFD